ncbi:MAG: DUF29 family protein [Runella slithyformis]|nr:MAG: DUF29 family protein [Runella slithyformis]
MTKKTTEMEELEALRKMIKDHDYSAALTLIDEMDEMGQKAIRNQIYSSIKILLLHLMKQQAEERTTQSWDLSIANAIDQINATNARNNARSRYIAEDELSELIEKAYAIALKNASAEAFGGALSEKEFAKHLDPTRVKKEALDLILNYES